MGKKTLSCFCSIAMLKNVGQIALLVSLIFSEHKYAITKRKIFHFCHFSLQVQAGVNSKRFNDSYDCIGFTSAPIWSGVFVSFIICFVVAFGLNQIMEIKPPNRFENSRGKQLTFTISE